MTDAPSPPLRRGWTTGACAAAAVAAAGTALATGRFPDPVTVRLPGGLTPTFALAHRSLQRGVAEAGVIKDAGDDPDVTHGAMIVARVARRARGAGLVFRAGEGVGTVTRPGLPLPVGAPAINPGPQALIADNLERTLGGLDAEVTLSVPGGAALAAQTLNGRLGIVGGLSILGTNGVVVPYSAAAWVHTIHRAVDVARAAGLDHLAGVTGKSSARGLATLHPHLSELSVIDVGDLIGGLLKYLRRHPVARLTIAGGFAKLAKLGAGRLNLQSRAGPIDHRWLSALVGALGGDNEMVAATALPEATALGVLERCQAAGLPIGAAVARHARAVALDRVGTGMAIEVAVFDRAGRLVGFAGDDPVLTGQPEVR